MMLVLSRKKDQEIVVDGGIVIRVLQIRLNSVRLGIQAPDGVNIVRRELVFDDQPPAAVHSAAIHAAAIHAAAIHSAAMEGAA